MNAYQNTYMQNQVQNASPEKILIMLYDGAIRFIRQGRLALEEGNKAEKLKKVSRAINILTELSNTLDFEQGGEFAENMDSLYWYMIRELTRSNAKNEPEPLDAVEEMLVDLRDAWVQAVDQQRGAAEGDDSQEAPVSRVQAAV